MPPVFVVVWLLSFFFLMIRRPPRSTLFPYNDALPIFVVVDADCLYSNTGEGLHRFVDPVDNEVYLYSQFETADAKRVYACFDQPDLKAVFTLHVTAPEHWQVVSNGREQSVDHAPAGKTVHFAPTPRVSPYVTAVVAGPYYVVRDHHDGID